MTKLCDIGGQSLIINTDTLQGGVNSLKLRLQVADWRLVVLLPLSRLLEETLFMVHARAVILSQVNVVFSQRLQNIKVKLSKWMNATQMKGKSLD